MTMLRKESLKGFGLFSDWKLTHSLAVCSWNICIEAFDFSVSFEVRYVSRPLFIPPFDVNLTLLLRF